MEILSLQESKEKNTRYGSKNNSTSKEKKTNKQLIGFFFLKEKINKRR